MFGRIRKYSFASIARNFCAIIQVAAKASCFFRSSSASSFSNLIRFKFVINRPAKHVFSFLDIMQAVGSKRSNLTASRNFYPLQNAWITVVARMTIYQPGTHS
jgi:hypothetical protein